MIKFADLIKTKTSGCAKCFAVTYALPCQLDKDIAGYLSSFGQPVYPMKSVSFLKIDTSDGFHIEGRMKSKVIKFTMPKKFEQSDINNIPRKIEFEKALSKWMSNKLNILIS